MKKLTLFICFFLLMSFAFSQDYKIVCPSECLNIIENEKIINKITGINFLSKNIAEAVIQREINKELHSNVKADLKLFNLKRLKNGEFKELTLKSKNLKYKALSATDVKVTTICPYNKILYKNKKLYFPQDISFKFTGTITNKDIENIINSVEFQNELSRNTLSFRGVNGIKFETPTVTIKDNYLNFSLPVTSFILKKPYNIKFKTNLEIKNNKIVLRNITFSSKRNIMNSDLFAPVIDAINPLSYALASINGKFCNIQITNAKITGDAISTDGILKINKNYGGQNE